MAKAYPRSTFIGFVP